MEHVSHRKDKLPYRIPSNYHNNMKKGRPPPRAKTKRRITFHDLPKSVKTNILAAGINYVCRNTTLGHSFTCMDLHYSQLSEDKLQAALQKYTNWLDG